MSADDTKTREKDGSEVDDGRIHDGFWQAEHSSVEDDFRCGSAHSTARVPGHVVERILDGRHRGDMPGIKQKPNAAWPSRMIQNATDRDSHLIELPIRKGDWPLIKLVSALAFWGRTIFKGSAWQAGDWAAHFQILQLVRRLQHQGMDFALVVHRRNSC